MKKNSTKYNRRDVEIVFNFFAKNKFTKVNLDVFEPTYSSIRKIYSKNKINIFTDIDIENNKSDMNINIYKIKTLVNLNHSRYGWRCSDYYRLWCLNKFKKKIIIYLDNDFEIVSNEFKVIEEFAKDYGMAIASNPRFTDRVDRKIGSDVRVRNYKNSDNTKGLGFAYNCGLFAIDTSNILAMSAVKFTLKEFKKDFERGPTVIYNAFRLKKFNPYLLPPPWNINNMEIMRAKHLFDDPIVLHLNHKSVKKAYKRNLLLNQIAANNFFIKFINVLRIIKRQIWI